MSTNEQENFDSTNEEEILVEEVEEDASDEQSEDTDSQEVDWKKKAEELEKENQTLKIQKAKIKEKAGTAKSEPQSDLSTKDLYALVSKQVAEDDISEVVDYAKFKGISVAEALNSNTVKTILNERAEQRKVAQATNTGTARRSSHTVSEEDLLTNAKKGQLPDSDSDIQRLVKARMGKK